MANFVVDSMIRGHHVYKEIWDPVNGEELPCGREIGNSSDPLAVAVMKRLDGGDNIVGHLPRRISSLCSAFIRRGGTIKCIVDGHRRYSEDLPQGGLEVPCKLRFEIKSLQVCNKTEGLIRASLAVTNAEYPDPCTKRVEKPTEHNIEIASCNIEANTMIPVASNPSELNAIDVDQICCSPVKKRGKHFDAERILMGEEMTDLEINFAQQLLKEQFKHISGLDSTLLQEKKVTHTKTLAKNKLQIVFCKERKHWIVATNINCAHNEVKVYDSLFQYLDKVSMECIENLFQHDNVSLKVRMIQCRRQTGTKDCGLFAVAFATALAFGQNPSRQNFKQEEMRSHLVNCFNKTYLSTFPCK